MNQVKQYSKKYETINNYLDQDRTAQEEKDERIAGLIERLQQQQDKSKEIEKIYEYIHDLTRMDVTYKS